MNSHPHITIVEAAPNHRESWLELRLALWPDCERDESSREISDIIESETLTAYLAFDENGTAVGFMELSMRDYVDGCSTSPVGYIEGIYVRPDHRHQRIGTKLIEAAEAWARAKGLAELGSDTHIQNSSSIEFHAANGFHETDRIVVFVKKMGSGLI